MRSAASRRPVPADRLGRLPVGEFSACSGTEAAARRPDDTPIAASLSPGDLLKALRGWWRCDAASVAAGGVLPVALSGYVVAVLTGLDNWERNTEPLPTWLIVA